MEDIFKTNPDLISIFFSRQNFVNEVGHRDKFQNHMSADPPILSNVSNHSSNLTPSAGISTTEETIQVRDSSDTSLQVIREILMEEELDDGSGRLGDYRALQATEKSLYDNLGETYPPSSHKPPSFVGPSLDYDFNRSGSTYGASDGATSESFPLFQNASHGLPLLPVSFSSSFHGASDGLANSPSSTLFVTEVMSEGSFDWPWNPPMAVLDSTCVSDFGGRELINDHKQQNQNVATEAEKGGDYVHGSRRKKNHRENDMDYRDARSNKHLASSNEDYVQMEVYDDIMHDDQGKYGASICVHGSSHNEERRKLRRNENSKGSTGRRMSAKKQGNKSEAVDLTNLLFRCAQAVASFESRGANELLMQIRQHSSPYGDSFQRLAHYFANGLEARLAGTGSLLSANLLTKPISSADILKAYQVYVSAIPFKRMSYFLANQTIAKIAAKATKIHIIDFGIFFGFQWPPLIQHLSERATGPPRLRITGIDFPEHGFRPAQSVEETGRRLAGYCERFNVPFEYHPVAKKWENIRPDDLKIQRDELVVVNCLYRSRPLLDETVEPDNPRDNFLKLIRKLNPNIFIHGIVNGSFDAPFFITRFREALFYYSSMFDLFEATMAREDNRRLTIERELYGTAVLNVIACEGRERLERPETYRQWQIRIHKAGFERLHLDQEIMNRAKVKVKANYHKEFVVDEDNHWMLQGWKGRILYALSCWKPV
ncbi:hypothetical protein Nepgr_013035 [Nepenthes gracilis]|uniref:Uncharacterized protein n=1 Tax=Nepenthes gracilis TaxID=150966 RepID=A0AAD3SID4_NEPGR|nr:hypothetical protein Nepgr_013035 [Nepenthes gracilis]